MAAHQQVIGNDPDDARDAGLGTDFMAVLARGVRRYRRPVVAIALTGAALGFAWGVARPDEYASEARLLLRIGARERVTSESLVGGDREHVTPPTVQDELQMLGDASIYERVARQMGPRRLLEPIDPTLDDDSLTPFSTRALHLVQKLALAFTPRMHECETEECPDCLRLASRLLKRETVITNEPDSNVIKLAYTSSSAARAQQVMQALVNACIERHNEQFSSQGVLDKNRGKLEAAKRDRDDAARSYFEHLASTDFVDLDSQYPACVVEINSIEDQLFSAHVRREEISRQLEALSATGAATATGTDVLRRPLVIPNTEYETQAAHKRELLAQRWNLAFEKLSEDERQQRERDYDARLAEVEHKLAQLPQPAVRTPLPAGAASMRLTGPALVEDLRSEDLSLSVKVDMLEQRLQEKRAKLTEITRQGLVEDLVRKDLASNREAKESSYQSLVERFAELEALVNMSLDDANLQVLAAPTFEGEPIGPKRVGLLFNGLVLGVVAACAYAVLRQRSDDRIWQPEAAEEACGVPVLGVVPAAGALRRAAEAPGRT